MKSLEHTSTLCQLMEAGEISLARYHRMNVGSLDKAVRSFCSDERVRLEIRDEFKKLRAMAASQGQRVSYPRYIRSAFHITAEMSVEFRGKKALGPAISA